MKTRRLLTKDVYIIALLVVIIPLAGELKFYPFSGTFRMSLGPPLFFFFILFLRHVPATLAGFLTGLSVNGFRIIVHFLLYGAFDGDLFYNPAFIFYLVFGILFDLLRVKRFKQQTMILGLLGMFIEIVSNMLELGVQIITKDTVITVSELNKICIIAIFRSFFVVGFFNMINLYEARLREKEIRKQNEHMLMVISNLYEESIHLKKTLHDAEVITKKAYSLYQELQNFESTHKDIEMGHFKQDALAIACEIHEIKKDNQRIYAGLSKLILGESHTNYMTIGDLLTVIVNSSRKYAELLHKKIKFDVFVDGDHPDYHVFSVLSLINNIVANAIEAVNDEGEITMSIHRDHEWMIIKISDNGPGISPKLKDLVFKPGFTSKYDQSGNPSTGIGLFYVKNVVEQYGGTVFFQNRPDASGAIFTMRIPIRFFSPKGEIG